MKLYILFFYIYPYSLKKNNNSIPPYLTLTLHFFFQYVLPYANYISMISCLITMLTIQFRWYFILDFGFQFVNLVPDS